MKQVIAVAAVLSVLSAAGVYAAIETDTAGLGAFSSEETVENPGNYTLGSAHRHALAFVIVDGEKLGFLEDRYQLAARHVHLESNMSHVVHSHAESVTWQDYFETIDMEVNSTGDEVCLDVKNVSRCGNGTATLNGEPLNSSNLMRQGDVLVVAIGENHTEASERWQESRLPGPYRRDRSPGRSVDSVNGKFKSPVPV